MSKTRTRSMHYTNEDIEFAIRLLNHREELPKEEVQQWLDDPGHQVLVDELAAIRRLLAAREERQVEAGGWRPLSRKRKGERKRRILIGWSAAASIIVLISIFSGIFFAKQEEAPTTEGPRKGFVELTLATGEQLFLDPRGEEDGESIVPRDAAGGLDYMQQDTTAADSTAGESYNTLRTPGGSAYQLTLADGTRVWVNEKTTIRYPVAFKGEERKVRLRGEAYFDVAHDPEHPFVVETGGVDVKVYGTEFNVNAQDSTRIQTVLVEGKVGMRVKETGEEVMLRPNQLGEYTRGEAGIEVREVEPYAYIAWKNGEFVFDGAEIEEIMDRLAGWYDVHVFYASEEAKHIRFSGILDRNDSITLCLERMESTGTVHFDRQGESITVYKP